MRSLLAGLVATIASTMVALVVVEVGLRMVGSVRNVGPSFTEFDETYGKRLKPDASIVRITPEFTMTLTTSADGFRGPPLPDSFDDAIIFTGDSFTMGYGVEDGEAFPALVRAALADEEIAVVNAGVGNTGNGHTLIWLEDNVVGAEVRHLVVQLTDNDFANNRDEKLFAISPQGTLERQPPRPPGTLRQIQAMVEAVPGLADLHLIGLLRQASTAMAAPAAEPVPTSTASDDALTYALVERILSLANAQNWPVLGLAIDIEGERAGRLAEVFESHGSPLEFIPPRTERPDLYFAVDGHWRASGHRFVADLVIEHFELSQRGGRDQVARSAVLQSLSQ